MVATYLRSSKHSLDFSNTNKKIAYHEFCQDYQEMVKHYVDYLWQDPLNCKNMLPSETCNQLYNTYQIIIVKHSKLLTITTTLEEISIRNYK